MNKERKKYITSRLMRAVLDLLHGTPSEVIKGRMYVHRIKHAYSACAIIRMAHEYKPLMDAIHKLVDIVYDFPSYKEHTKRFARRELRYK